MTFRVSVCFVRSVSDMQPPPVVAVAYTNMMQFFCLLFGTSPRALRVRHLLPNQTLAVVHSRQSAAHRPTTIVHCSAVLSKSD